MAVAGCTCPMAVASSSAANAFLQCGRNNTPMEFLSDSAERISRIRCKDRLSGQDQEELLMYSSCMLALFRYASADVFREHVPETELQAWLDCIRQELSRFVNHRKFIETGDLQPHDAYVLNSCIFMFCHAVPTAMALESDLFQRLADMIRARKAHTGRALPSKDVSETITLLVSNAYISCRMAFDNPWTTEKALKKLEATGILAEHLRCATIPQQATAEEERLAAPGLFRMLDDLQACAPFLGKKFKPGEPCGDMVQTILEGTDGSPIQRPSILAKLRTIVRVVDSINREDHDPTTIGKMCRYCGKSEHSQAFQNSLMLCGNCKQAYYCSMDCQKADWKQHKKVCVPAKNSDTKKVEKIQNMLMTFSNQQYLHIMVKMVKACKQYGLDKKDMLVELNFTTDHRGKIPALQDPPEFNIAPVKDNIKGSRPAEPDWFFKSQDKAVYESNVKGYIHAIQSQFDRMLPSHFLCLVRHASGTSCYKVQLMEPERKNQMYSHEAVLAFKAYMENPKDDGPLSCIFGPNFMRIIKRQLARYYSIGLSEEELMQNARHVLKHMFGADF